MSHWLYRLISDDDPSRRPDFAQTSALNWMRALAFEIEKEHGAGFDNQWQSVEKHLASIQPRGLISHSAQVFEPLYAAVSFTTSLVSLASDSEVGAWRCPGAIVEWYYAVYNACRAMIAACNLAAPDKHAAVARTLNGAVRDILPHPLNMRAVHVVNEDFDIKLPSFPSVKRLSGVSPLTEAFDDTRDHAQQMLLSYLRGTAEFYVWDTKQDLLRRELKKVGLTNFKSKQARQIREARLKGTEYNFLHLAFRYRGKANYRDAVFLAYGAQHLADGGEFVYDLATVARFATIVGLIYVRMRLGTKMFDEFIDDLKVNFKGYAALRSFP